MPDGLSDVLESTEPTLLATGFGATEGPLWHPGGYLTFVDIPNSQLLRWDPAGGVSVLRQDTREGNGCTLDRQGRLIMCEGGDDRRRITRMEDDSSITPIAERFQGKRINKPNDVVCRSDGSIYFTDPDLRLPQERREVGFPGVYRIDPEGRLNLATNECEYPNGMAFSGDEAVLYVAITRKDEGCFEEEQRNEVCTHRLLRAFDVAPDGTLSHNRIFTDMSSSGAGGPDGVKVDVEGHVPCTSSGTIWVMDSAGVVLGTIGALPEGVRNMAFGGSDFRSLFITGGKSLYSLRTKTPGIGAF
jgi:gluconolactonase